MFLQSFDGAPIRPTHVSESAYASLTLLSHFSMGTGGSLLRVVGKKVVLQMIMQHVDDLRRAHAELSLRAINSRDVECHALVE
jgi:hypothetical protein